VAGEPGILDRRRRGQTLLTEARPRPLAPWPARRETGSGLFLAGIRLHAIMPWPAWRAQGGPEGEAVGHSSCPGGVTERPATKDAGSHAASSAGVWAASAILAHARGRGTGHGSGCGGTSCRSSRHREPKRRSASWSPDWRDGFRSR
jgi:hypothetical protein